MAQFRDFVTLQRGFDLTKTEMRDGHVPVVGSTSIIGFHDVWKVAPPGVVTGRSGSLGTVQYINEPFWPHNTSLWVKDFKGNDPHFVYYRLQGFDFGRFNAGAGVPTLNRNHLDTLELDIPPLQTQRRIASILSAYDELIENNQRRIRILEDMARSLYREWFVHFRYPGHENERSEVSSLRPSVPLVDSPLGRIPQGWEVKKLGDIAEDMRRNIPKGQLDEPQPYVGLEHIPRRSLALDSWEIASELGSNKLAFKKGEVLFGKIRPYFHKVSIAPFDGLCSADTIVIRARQPEHYAIVVGCVSSDEFVAHATATSNGSKMPRANWSVLKERPIAIPTLTVARQFSAVVEPAIQQMQTLIFQTTNLRHTRDLLLPRLLSGQIALATDTPPIYDEDEFKRMVEKGTQAWAGVPDSAAWVETLRGNKE